MSYMLPHLHNGWQVDQAILSEEDRVCVCKPFTVSVQFVFCHFLILGIFTI